MLGPEHPNTLRIIYNLAVVLENKGNYKAAEGMQRHILELREKVLGPKHPATLTSINNLIKVLSDQDKYKIAEEMH